MLARHPGIVATAALALATLTLAAAAAAQRTRYIAFGDSITEGVGFDSCPCDDFSCRQLCGYPRRLRNLLNAAGVDAGVLNYGLGGERTCDGLTRIDHVLDEIGGHVLLLMEGTNDISRSISPETTLANLEEMARKASLRGLDTVHVTLIPRFPAARVDAENVLNADMASRIRDLAFVNERRLVDPFEVFGREANLFERLYSPAESDPVGHPNPQGFDLLATAFFNVLMGIDDVPPVLGPVQPANGSEGVSPFTPIQVRLYDFGAGIDAAASMLFVNDEPVSFTSEGGVVWQDLRYTPEVALPTDVTVRVASRDVALNAMEREVARFRVDEAGPGPCHTGSTTLCIDEAAGDQRFQVTLHWHTGQGGDAREGDAEAIPLASIGLRRGGLFSFFSRDNPELLVKVLDGCAINDRFWVFAAPTTNVGYTLRIVDTAAAVAGAAREEWELVVTNPDGRDAPPFSSTSAFATCAY